MTTLVNTLYNRLVGRDAAASEIAGWTAHVESGAVNHDYIGITLVNAILNLPESTGMRQVMMAKLDSANHYSNYLATDAADLAAYSTSAGHAAGASFVASVTGTTAKSYAEAEASADLLSTPKTFSLTASPASAAEGDKVTFTLTLDSAPTEDVVVNYVTSTGTAGTSDYTSTSSSVTFAAGQSTKFVTIQTTEDSAVETAETFNVTFSGTRLNSSVTAVGTITNDDVAVTAPAAPTYSLIASAATAAEGDSLTFALTLSSAPTEAVVVNYATSTGTAGLSDYTSASSSVTFAAGQTTQFVTVSTTEDTDIEANETFTVTFSGASLNASVQATGTITNDDVAPAAAPTYTLSVADVSAAEGDTATFALTLSSAATEAVTVNYATAVGTADATDFTSASGTVTFAVGQTTQFVNITTKEDTTFEGSETFTVNFTGSALNAAVTATGTITNDDADPATTAQTFTLTTGKNTFTGLGGDDTFNASTENSLTSIDVLDGGAGSDTLVATLNGLNTAVQSTAIEQFDLTVRGGASTVNLLNTTGVTSINNINSNSDLTITNLATLPAFDISSTDMFTNISFSTAALAGTADDLAFNISDISAQVVAGATQDTIVLGRATGATGNIETVSLNSTLIGNAIQLNTAGVGTTSLEVTGSANLTINGLEAGITTLNASTFTGALTTTSNSAAAAAATITTGSGADVLTVGRLAADTVVSGAGNDSVTINDNAGGGIADTLVSITTGDGNDTITATGAGLTDTISAGAGTDTIVVGTNNLNLGTATNWTGYEVVETDGAGTVTVTDAVLALAGGSITLNETGADTAVTVNAAVAAGTSNVILGNAASFTLADVDGNRVTIADAADAAGDGVGNDSTEVVTLSTTNTGSIVTGSASQDTVLARSSGTAGHNVNLGAANDTVNGANTLAADDTIVGGDGTDTIAFATNAAADLSALNKCLWL